MSVFPPPPFINMIAPLRTVIGCGHRVFPPRRAFNLTRGFGVHISASAVPARRLRSRISDVAARRSVRHLRVAPIPRGATRRTELSYLPSSSRLATPAVCVPQGLQLHVVPYNWQLQVDNRQYSPVTYGSSVRIRPRVYACSIAAPGAQSGRYSRLDVRKAQTKFKRRASYEILWPWVRAPRRARQAHG